MNLVRNNPPRRIRFDFNGSPVGQIDPQAKQHSRKTAIIVSFDGQHMPSRRQDFGQIEYKQFPPLRPPAQLAAIEKKCEFIVHRHHQPRFDNRAGLRNHKRFPQLAGLLIRG